jgi:hypothetical protein
MALILAKQGLSSHCGQGNPWGSNCQLLPAFWVKRGSLLNAGGIGTARQVLK